MTKDEALKLALWHEAMAREPNRNQAKREKHEATAKFIKKSLAHPEQYPQIAINPEIVGYVAPQRTWVGLTDEDIWEAYMESTVELDCSTDELYALSRTVEAKLKEKNTLLKNNRRK